MRATVALQVLDDPLYRLGVFLRDNEYASSGRHHDRVADPDQSDARLIAIGEAVACLLKKDFAFSESDVAGASFSSKPHSEDQEPTSLHGVVEGHAPHLLAFSATA